MSNLHFFNILFGNSRRNNINEIIEEASFSSFINLEELINNIDLSNIINDLSNQLTNIVDNMDFSYIYFDSSIILLDNSFIFSDSSFIFSDSSFIFSEINSDNNRKKVLLNSDFEKLEKKKFNNNEALKKEYNLECPISLKDFNNNDEIIVLPCNHIFLEENIKKWLTLSSNDCPICRRKIIID
jgi:hypothetical protein